MVKLERYHNGHPGFCLDVFVNMPNGTTQVIVTRRWIVSDTLDLVTVTTWNSSLVSSLSFRLEACLRVGALVFGMIDF